MNRNRHIEVFIFKIVNDQKYFLLMKRTKARGGFWQPLTGGVEGEESLEQAVVREIEEETGIRNLVSILDSGFSFEFSDGNGDFVEYVYAVEVVADTVVNLSCEHDEFRWATNNEAMSLLKWEDNKNGLNAVQRII